MVKHSLNISNHSSGIRLKNLQILKKYKSSITANRTFKAGGNIWGTKKQIRGLLVNVYQLPSRNKVCLSVCHTWDGSSVLYPNATGFTRPLRVSIKPTPNIKVKNASDIIFWCILKAKTTLQPVQEHSLIYFNKYFSYPLKLSKKTGPPQTKILKCILHG